MNSHPYLKTYMAGVLLPSLFLLVVLTAFVVERLVFQLEFPIEQIIVFPMAVVPNLWGVWNVIYLAAVRKSRLPLGVWGAVLPIILAPGGLALQRLLGASFFTMGQVAIVLPVAVAVYYLLWKHAVGFFNDVVGVGVAH